MHPRMHEGKVTVPVDSSETSGYVGRDSLSLLGDRLLRSIMQQKSTNKSRRARPSIPTQVPPQECARAHRGFLVLANLSNGIRSRPVSPLLDDRHGCCRCETKRHTLVKFSSSKRAKVCPPYLPVTPNAAQRSPAGPAHDSQYGPRFTRTAIPAESAVCASRN